MIRRVPVYNGRRHVPPYTSLSICQGDGLRRLVPSSMIVPGHVSGPSFGPRDLALRSPGNIPEEHFIYCIVLPGFECHSSPVRQPSDPTMVKMIQESLPRYIMVKVGISRRVNPADRLNEIMRGFEGFGASNTHFQNLDKDDNIVDKCKQEESIIFLKRCYDVERNVRDAETKIRRLLGQDLGHSFRDQFTRKLDSSKHQYIGQVGMTEWILTDTNRIKYIQNEFRKNGIARSPLSNTARPDAFQQNPTGNDIYKQIFGLVDIHNFLQLQTKLHVARLAVYNVEIKFRPTGFSFPLKCQ